MRNKRFLNKGTTARETRNDLKEKKLINSKEESSYVKLLAKFMEYKASHSSMLREGMIQMRKTFS